MNHSFSRCAWLAALVGALALPQMSRAAWVKVYDSQEDEDVIGGPTEDLDPWGGVNGKGTTSWYFIDAAPRAPVSRLELWVQDAEGDPAWSGWNWSYRIKIGASWASAIGNNPDTQISGEYTQVHSDWDPAADLTGWPLWRQVDLETPFTMSADNNYILKFEYVSGGAGTSTDTNYWISRGDNISHYAYVQNFDGTIYRSTHLQRLRMYANLPNLLVFAFYPSPGTLWSHRLAHFTIDVKNHSDVGVASPFDVALKYRKSGTETWIPVGDEQTVDSLAAGGHATASWHWAPPDAGWYQFEVEVDVDDVITEVAEDDNFLSYIPGDHKYRVYGESSTRVETLLITDSFRWVDVGYSQGEANSLLADLDYLAQNDPRGRGVVVDIADFEPDSDLIEAREAWLDDFGTAYTKAATNAYVQEIDALIEDLVEHNYPSLGQVILVGSHEIVPMYVRSDEHPGDSTEYTWAGNNYDAATDMRFLYQSGTNGSYLTDVTYADLGFRDSGSKPWLTREIAVGRLVETPGQISVLIDDYFTTSNGMNPMEDIACIGSKDFTDGALTASDHLADCGYTADTTLASYDFASTLVPPKFDAKNDLVYIGGHGNYNLMKTDDSPYDAFWAGNHATQGDTDGIGSIATATVVAAGCHNGALLPNQTYNWPSASTGYRDFPEEFAVQEALAYVASTAYTWISTGSHPTAYTEELCAETVRRYGHGYTIGEAYRQAANQYQATHKGDSADAKAHEKVLGIHQVYGLPGYKARQGDCGELLGYQFGNTHWSQSGDIITVETTLTLNTWSVAPGGVIVIPGASYMGGPSTPVLPVILYTEPVDVPPRTCVKSALVHVPGSTYMEFYNHVPTMAVGNADTTVYPQTFSYPDYFPAAQCAGFTVPSDGGTSAEIGLRICPVQFNPMTGMTRVWEQMVVIFSYDMTQVPFAETFSGADTDQWTLTQAGAAHAALTHLDGVSPMHSLEITGSATSGDYVRVESVPIDIDFTKPYHLELWFKYSSFHWNRFLIFGHVRLLLDYPYMAIKYDPVGDNSFVGHSVGPAFNSYAPANTWMPIRIDVDPATREYALQINGVEVGSVSYQSSVEPSATLWVEDNGSGNNDLNALYDDFLVLGSRRPSLVADFDHDGDVDTDDYVVFSQCLEGPQAAVAITCQACDLDADEDVDVADFGMLQNVFAAP